jgi:hypothetical protein
MKLNTAKIALISRRFIEGFGEYTAAQVATMIGEWSAALNRLGDDANACEQRCAAIARVRDPMLALEYSRLKREAGRLQRDLNRMTKPIANAPEPVQDYLTVLNHRRTKVERDDALQRFRRSLRSTSNVGRFENELMTALWLTIIRAESPKAIKVGAIVDDYGEPVGAPPARERGIATEDFRRWLGNALRDEMRSAREADATPYAEIPTGDAPDVSDRPLPARPVADHRGADLSERPPTERVIPAETVDRTPALTADDVAIAVQNLDTLDGIDRAIVLASATGVAPERTAEQLGISVRSVYRRIERITERLTGSSERGPVHR